MLSERYFQRLSKFRGRDRIFFQWFILLLLPIFILISIDFPVNIDELLHYSHARRIIDWYLSGGTDRACFDTPVSNLKYYGQSVDNLSALINRILKPDNEYLIRHIIGAIFGWLLILFTSLGARELTGRYSTASVAGILMLLLPPVMGQFCNNLKDIPFAAGYAFCMFSTIRVFNGFPHIPWKHVVQLTIGIAFLISVRVGGLVLYPYLLLFLLVWIFISWKQNRLQDLRGGILRRFILKGLLVLVAGYFGGLLFWPFGLENPIVHPLESLSMMEHYSISIRQIFRGSWFWSTSLPGTYLPVWLIISIPEIIMLGFVFYLITLVRRKDTFSFNEFIILFAFLFPLIYVLIIDSNLYSGWRQMYFLAPPMVILSALGMERMQGLFSKRRMILISLAALLILSAIPPLRHYYKNPDTSYVYFNTLSGGNKKAWSRFEYDYYWHGMKRAAEWFDEHIPDDGTSKTLVSNFDISVYLAHRRDIKVSYIHYDMRSREDWDYGVFGVNYIHPVRLRNGTWEPGDVKAIISDNEHPLAVIAKRGDMHDYEGIQLVREGNYEDAIAHLLEAVSDDENNYLLYEYLAESYYHLNLPEDCRQMIELGKEVHSTSERLGMIEAQLEYDAGDYQSALKRCLAIVNNNSKYAEIVPLLIACYEKNR